MRVLPAGLLSLLLVSAAGAATLPGFRVELLGATSGFASSLAFDSHGTLYYSTLGGDIVRFDDGANRLVAHVSTHAVSNAGLLGMALLDDSTAVVHYTLPGDDPQTAVTWEVLSRIDLTTGAETQLARLAGNPRSPGAGVPSEHHGGNPVVAPDGSVFLPIGDFAIPFVIALDPQGTGGKIFRVFPDGTVQLFARGFRNPYDLVWDAARQRVIVADNGESNGDQLLRITFGDDAGWPYTFGGVPPIAGTRTPTYVWTQTIAPTGQLAPNGANESLRSGLIVAGFVSRALHYFPDVDATPLPPPVVLISRESPPIIDVAQTAGGEIYFTSGMAVYHLSMPRRGDCNGDGLVNAADVTALTSELADAPEAATSAQAGSFVGSWGCDANGDGTINAADRDALLAMTTPRRRAVRVSSSSNEGGPARRPAVSH